MRLSVLLYEEPSASTLDLGEVARHIRGHLPTIEVTVREEFVQRYLTSLSPTSREEALSSLAEKVAALRLRSLTHQGASTAPLPGEIQYESKRLEGGAGCSFGVMYEGFGMMRLFQGLTAQEERSPSHLHIVFTNQLLGTWEDSDRRYHARAIICGLPAIISTTGIVEAPAKPREYYLLKQQYHSLGMYDAEAALASRFQGRFIDHGDARMTGVVKGYAMQALFHHLTGEAFCEDPNCRLFNAHWQEELIHAQLEGEEEFCQHHAEQLARMREATNADT
ncbi:MAG: DUF6775 family putative metallopeptidase [Chloroflexota bacterium]